jgi:ABC-type lipoprotein release transport system permease subunit
MLTTLKMAYRDILRNKRRSFFSALALGVGVGLLLLLAAVYEGEIRGSLEASIRLESGHMQVRAQSFDITKSSLKWEDLVADPEAVAAQIATLPQVASVTPRLLASGILSLADQSVGVRILGIDPDAAASAVFRQGLTAGTFLAPDDRQGVLIGQTLADRQELTVGQQIPLLVNTANGTVDEQLFTVRGIYNTHTPSYDGSTVFMPLAKAQAITQTEGHASLLFVLLKDGTQTDAVAAALRSDQYQVVTYTQMNEMITQLGEMTDVILWFMYLIILGITATVVINTLVMAVFERTREIGILAALGMKPRRIMAMFFAEAGFIAVGGIILGMILGGIVVYLAATRGFYIGDMGVTGMILGERIYAYLNISDAVNISIAALVITLLAGLYPALLASRLEPVTALHGGSAA